MRYIQNLDLKNKLVLLAAVSAAMALLMACSGFVWHDLRLLKTAQVEELQTKAEMLAITGACAISHQQPEALKLLVDAVKAYPTIETVCVFNNRGEPVTSMSADDEPFAELKLP